MKKIGLNICKTVVSKYVDGGRAKVRLPMGFLTPTSLAHTPFHFLCARGVEGASRSGRRANGSLATDDSEGGLCPLGCGGVELREPAHHFLVAPRGFRLPSLLV